MEFIRAFCTDMVLIFYPFFAELWHLFWDDILFRVLFIGGIIAKLLMHFNIMDDLEKDERRRRYRNEIWQCCYELQRSDGSIESDKKAIDALQNAASAYRSVLK